MFVVRAKTVAHEKSTWWFKFETEEQAKKHYNYLLENNGKGKKYNLDYVLLYELETQTRFIDKWSKEEEEQQYGF